MRLVLALIAGTLFWWSLDAPTRVVEKVHTLPFNSITYVGHIPIVAPRPECWRLDLSDDSKVCVAKTTWDATSVGAVYVKET